MSSSPKSEDSDIESMTKAQLLAYAEEHGIEGVNSRMLKADIMEVIRNA